MKIYNHLLFLKVSQSKREPKSMMSSQRKTKYQNFEKCTTQSVIVRALHEKFGQKLSRF